MHASSTSHDVSQARSPTSNPTPLMPFQPTACAVVALALLTTTYTHGTHPCPMTIPASRHNPFPGAQQPILALRLELAAPTPYRSGRRLKQAWPFDGPPQEVCDCYNLNRQVYVRGIILLNTAPHSRCHGTPSPMSSCRRFSAATPSILTAPPASKTSTPRCSTLRCRRRSSPNQALVTILPTRCVQSDVLDVLGDDPVWVSATGCFAQCFGPMSITDKP